MVSRKTRRKKQADYIKTDVCEIKCEAPRWMDLSKGCCQLRILSLTCYKKLSSTLIFISSPVKGLEWPRGFQEVKVPRFHDNGTGWW